MSGLHNISLSPANPGCVWLSLQFKNELILLDAKTMAIRQIRRPQLHAREWPGGSYRPAACASAARRATLRRAQGSVPCHPGVAGSSKRTAAAITRVCCNPEAIKARMEAARTADGDAKPVTELFPGARNLARAPEAVRRARGRGLRRLLFRASRRRRWWPSTTRAMSGRARTSSRACCESTTQRLSPATKGASRRSPSIFRRRAPWREIPPDDRPRVRKRADGIWSTLGGEGQVNRIGKDGKKSRYELPPDKEGGWRAQVHSHAVRDDPGRWHIFNDEKWVFPKTNNLLLISSNLVDDKAINAITYISFNPLVGTGWRHGLAQGDPLADAKLLLPSHRDRPRRAAEECRCVSPSSRPAPLPDAAVPRRELGDARGV